MKFIDKVKELYDTLDIIPADVIQEQDAPATPAGAPAGTPPNPAAPAAAPQLYDAFVIFRSDTKKPVFKGKFPAGTMLSVSKVATKKTGEEIDNMLQNSTRFKI